MLKSCKYCGRIHEKSYECKKKPKRKAKDCSIDIVRFRRTEAWKRKSIEIRVRDKYLCQLCIRNLYDTQWQYTCEGLSVHHAVSISDDWDKRLDNDNLLTVCDMHHKMAESGQIPIEVIKKIIQEQEAGD